MRQEIELLDPAAEPTQEVEGSVASVSLKGATIGLLWNGKPNADRLLKALSSELQERYGVADFIWEQKWDTPLTAGAPATSDQIDRLSEADAVITASGD